MRSEAARLLAREANGQFTDAQQSICCRVYTMTSLKDRVLPYILLRRKRTQGQPCPNFSRAVSFPDPIGLILTNPVFGPKFVMSKSNITPAPSLTRNLMLANLEPFRNDPTSNSEAPDRNWSATGRRRAASTNSPLLLRLVWLCIDERLKLARWSHFPICDSGVHYPAPS